MQSFALIHFLVGILAATYLTSAAVVTERKSSTEVSSSAIQGLVGRFTPLDLTYCTGENCTGTCRTMLPEDLVPQICNATDFLFTSAILTGVPFPHVVPFVGTRGCSEAFELTAIDECFTFLVNNETLQLGSVVIIED